MGRIFNFLRDKKTQYVIIVWILLIKVLEIVACLLSRVKFLHFFEVLGFNYLSITSRTLWDTILVFTILWLVYRLSKDLFQISLRRKSLSKRSIMGFALLLAWTVSAAITIFQVAIITTLSSADPRLEISKYSTPHNVTDGKQAIFFKIDGTVAEKIVLNLSKSVFSDSLPFSEAYKISEFGTEDGGASYFILKNSPLGQKMIEMRFYGNGTDGLQGWFANKIPLKEPLHVNGNSTFMLLLKLEASSDGTAWTYVKLDFQTTKNKTYSLIWKFHDKLINGMFSSDNGTRRTYLLGSAVDWSFYQFSLYNVFYTSFSDYPQSIVNVEYGVGAEADNNIKAQFLLAKISNHPLEVNGELVESVNPTVKIEDGSEIQIQGLNITKLYVTNTLKPSKENVYFHYLLNKISRHEAYQWNISMFQEKDEMKIRFYIASNLTKIILNGKEITQKQRNQETFKLESSQEEITLMVINEIDTFFMPIITAIIFPLFLFVWKLEALRAHKSQK